jgi:hypothetical protein
MKIAKWAMGFAIKSADAVMTPTNILVGVYFFVNKRRERSFFNFCWRSWIRV